MSANDTPPPATYDSAFLKACRREPVPHTPVWFMLQAGRSLPDLRHILACYERAEEFDVINDHTGPLGAVLGGLLSTPVVHTVHGPLDGEPGDVYASIGQVAPSVGLISISLNQRRPKPDLNWIANVPNALDLEHYPCKPHRGDYLLFLGRMNHEKGAHRAIAVAIELGLPLKMALNRRSSTTGMTTVNTIALALRTKPRRP